MNRFYSLVFSSASLLLFSGSVNSATEMWSTEGFKNPESALYDSSRDIIYVSNVNGGPGDADGNGFISRLKKDGTVDELEWIGGLNAPKGLVQSDGKLYVSDINQLVEIDLDAGEISNTWTVEDAKFLNDLAVDDSGNIYVSDMLGNTIYRLENNELTTWLQDDSLQHPNGLSIEGSNLLVAPWGKDLQDDFSTKVPGHLLSVGLGDKKISTLGSGKPVGNLDGLEPDGNGGWYVTDWIAGGLFRVNNEGEAVLLLDMNQGSADLGVINDESTVLVPMMMDNKVIALTVE